MVQLMLRPFAAVVMPGRPATWRTAARHPLLSDAALRALGLPRTAPSARTGEALAFATRCGPRSRCCAAIAMPGEALADSPLLQRLALDLEAQGADYCRLADRGGAKRPRAPAAAPPGGRAGSLPARVGQRRRSAARLPYRFFARHVLNLREDDETRGANRRSATTAPGCTACCWPSTAIAVAPDATDVANRATAPAYICRCADRDGPGRRRFPAVRRQLRGFVPKPTSTGCTPALEGGTGRTASVSCASGLRWRPRAAGRDRPHRPAGGRRSGLIDYTRPRSRTCARRCRQPLGRYAAHSHAALLHRAPDLAAVSAAASASTTPNSRRWWLIRARRAARRAVLEAWRREFAIDAGYAAAGASARRGRTNGFPRRAACVARSSFSAGSGRMSDTPKAGVTAPDGASAGRAGVLRDRLRSSPRRVVVVEACAGPARPGCWFSRIVRALFDGAQPESSITFTKKAAGERREQARRAAGCASSPRWRAAMKRARRAGGAWGAASRSAGLEWRTPRPAAPRVDTGRAVEVHLPRLVRAAAGAALVNWPDEIGPILMASCCRDLPATAAR